jgi:putative ABC transport system permease protein
VLSELALPILNTLADKQIDIRYGADWPFLLLLAGIGLLTGVVAGSYPALHLSAFRPVAVLKGGHGHKTSLRRLLSPANFRKRMVVTQFTLSIICIVSTLVISDQLDYFRNKDLGFDQEQVLVMRVQDREMRRQFETVKHELASHPDVLKVAAAGFVPGSGRGVYQYQLEGSAQIQNVVTYFTDHDFINAMGMEIASGRDFSQELETDVSAAFIVNETAVKHFGWEKPLQKKITWDGSKSGVVVGVVQDFHFQSMHQTIEPLIMHIEPDYLRYFVIRLNASNVGSTLGFIEEIWTRFDPQNPFSSTFLDDDFEGQYLSEQRLSDIFDYASILTVAIACLGLFGLASFIPSRGAKRSASEKSSGQV